MVRLLRSVAIARALGADVRGAIATVTVVTDTLGRATTLGLGSAANREAARSEERGRRAVATNVLWALATSPISILSGFAIAYLTFWNIAPEVLIAAGIAISLWIFFLQVGSAAEGYWLANRPELVTVANFVGATMGMAAVGLYFLDALNIMAAILLTAAGPIVPFFFYFTRLRVPIGERLSLSSQLKFGLRSYPALLSNSLNQRLDVVFVAAILGYDLAGQYTVAASSAQILTTFGVAWALRVQVRMNREEELTGAKALNEMRETTVSALGVAVLSSIGVPFLILIVYGSEFRPALVPAFLLLPGAVAQVVGVVGARSSILIGRPEVPSKAELLGLAITLIGLAPFLLLFEITGAAILSTIAYGARTIYIWHALRSEKPNNTDRSRDS